MPLVLAATPSEPEVAPDAFAPWPMTWTGFDGTFWVLSGPDASNPRMGRGVKGLHLPPVDVFTSQTPLVPGVDVVGYSLPERSAYWPLLFRASSSEQWRVEHAAFFDSFHPVRTGTWTVGTGDSARSIDLRGAFTGGHSFDRDPFVTGLAWIGIDLYAPRPLWRGQPIRQTFLGAEAGVDFIPDAPGDVYYLSSDSSFALANIDNPGNEPAYLTWTVHGPASSIELGVDGAIIEVPIPVPDGSTLVIDTDPARQFATLDGEDVTPELGFQVFGPVPARGTSPLVIQAEGTGSVVAELTPLYWRAY
ncbi:hypothetical protein Q9S78_12040 [Microbacterium sp. KSW-18]|uniref:Phage tail protein n=1 Tax=Microbacterium aquilitoris TaxID=3067307 RepID=A0ABU3GLQ9_9MICO|nr:hypothetical protein [Microbacterium sp. KSW-18]MDT3331399.1 hypothetical protein [Microbacterium sp. KSW-18]